MKIASKPSSLHSSDFALETRAFSRKRIIETLLIWNFRLVSYFMVAIVGVIVLFIVLKGAPELTAEFLCGYPRNAGADGGILPAIVGTFYLMGLAFLFSFPLSLGTAVYLNEYAGQSKFSRFVRVALLTLSGVPSIVYGLFGLALFVIQFHFGVSILSGSLTLALMIMPTITVASEEVLSNVPYSFREASRSLGAGKAHTIFSLVIPSAMPGICTGSLLSLGRAAGETAPILLTAAAFYLPFLPRSIFDEVMAIPYHLFVLSTQHPDMAAVAPKQYASALVLLMIVFACSIIAFVIRKHRQA